MKDFLRAVHRDRSCRQGDCPIPHLIEYIGYDRFLDVVDVDGLLREARGNSSPHKGVFALSCLGNTYIRPAITRSNAHILLLNLLPSKVAGPGY